MQQLEQLDLVAAARYALQVCEPCRQQANAENPMWANTSHQARDGLNKRADRNKQSNRKFPVFIGRSVRAGTAACCLCKHTRIEKPAADFSGRAIGRDAICQRPLMTSGSRRRFQSRMNCRRAEFTS